MIRKQPQSGFTLVELVVYLGILSVATLVFSSFLVDVIRNNGGTRDTRDIQENARFIMSRMQQDIRSANSATVTGGDLVLSGTSTITYHRDGATQALSVNTGGGATTLTSTGILVTTFTPTIATNHSTQTVNLSLTFATSNPASPSTPLTLTSSTLLPRTLYQ